MKLSFQNILLLLVVALGMTCAVLFWQWREERNQHIISQQNYVALANGITHTQNSTGGDVATSGVRNLQLSDIKDSIIDAIRKELKIRPRNVETILTNNITTEKFITVKVKDTILYNNVKGDVFHYEDKWTQILYIKDDDTDSATVNYVTSAKLTQVLYKERRGWNIFKEEWWQRRPVKQTLSIDNPNISITYADVIKIDKK